MFTATKPENAAYAANLVKGLADIENGRVVTWAEVNGLAQTDVRGGGYFVWRAAQRILLSDYNQAWRVVRGYGVRRSDSKDIIEQMPNKIRGVFRKASNLRSVATKVNLKELDEDERRTAWAQQAQIGALVQLAHGNTRRKIVALCEADPKISTLPDSKEVLRKLLG